MNMVPAFRDGSIQVRTKHEKGKLSSAPHRSASNSDFVLDVAALTVYKRGEEYGRSAKRPRGFEHGNFLPTGQRSP